MPEFDRRFFLQLTGAAGLAPALPAMPARAAPATVTASAPMAKMLWASLHARAGSTAKLQATAQSLGLSAKAAQSVSAKVAATSLIAQRAGTSSAPKIDVRRWLMDDPDDEVHPKTDKDPET